MESDHESYDTKIFDLNIRLTKKKFRKIPIRSAVKEMADRHAFTHTQSVKTIHI